MEPPKELVVSFRGFKRLHYIREDLVMVGWKCQNSDCGEVEFEPKQVHCHCGGELVLVQREDDG